ncbi:MAG: mannose-6-phosphate isomerase [Sediminicola sp.]
MTNYKHLDILNKRTLYPLKFQPILKEKVWGGNKLAHFFGKEELNKTGESWEISGVEGNVSIVANGSLKGRSLLNVIQEYDTQLLGNRVYKTFGYNFPLLFKFIDAKEDLSVQLHPNDELAKKHHDSFGKTEMWYIMQAEENARIILGFNSAMDEAKYVEKISENKITEILHSENVKTGDSFLIEPGAVHAIGAGVVLAEIQQTSDVTYRIYDWDRPGIDGKLRELHLDLALEAINFANLDAKLEYSLNEDLPVQLCSSLYFETNRLLLTKKMTRDLSSHDSFIVYMCVEGEVIIETTDFSEEMKKGETLLIPASLANIVINTTGATILEIYIP